MLISTEAKVKVGSKTLQKYRNLGYVCNVGDEIIVKVSELSTFAKTNVVVACDYCGKTFEVLYASYNTNKDVVDKDCCYSCRHKKAKDVVIEKYNVDNVSCLQDIKDKKAATTFQHYGVYNVSNVKDIQEKKKETCMSRYGVESYFQTEEFKTKFEFASIEKYGVKDLRSSKEIAEKKKATSLKRYGVECHLSHKEIRNKIQKTNLERYGFENVFSSPIIREKIQETLYQHGNIATSKIQYKLYETLLDMGYEVKLNYRVGKYFLDVALFYCGKQIDIEYDGQYWHQDTEKDEQRNDYLIQRGWNVIRIRSGMLLPNMKHFATVIERVAKEDIPLDILILKDWDKKKD